MRDKNWVEIVSNKVKEKVMSVIKITFNFNVFYKTEIM